MISRLFGYDFHHMFPYATSCSQGSRYFLHLNGQILLKNVPEPQEPICFPPLECGKELVNTVEVQMGTQVLSQCRVSICQLCSGHANRWSTSHGIGSI